MTEVDSGSRRTRAERTGAEHSGAGSLEVRLPERGLLGVEIRCSDPLRLAPAEVERIRALVWKHRLVVFRGMRLSNPEYVRFARLFGTPEPYHLANYHHPDHAEIFVSSNIPLAGQKVGVAGTGRFWHTDYAFMPRPLSMTMVYPQVVPPGRRGTKFIDMHSVWEALPADLRLLIEGRRCFHDAADYYKIQPKDIDRAVVDLVREFHEHAPGAWHPAVITHPVTGEQGLYVNEGFTRKISGMTHEEYGAVLLRLNAFVNREEHEHFEHWHAGDLFLWDNRLLNHHAGYGSPGQQSCSFRISIYDGLPFYVGHVAEPGASPGAEPAAEPRA